MPRDHRPPTRTRTDPPDPLRAGSIHHVLLKLLMVLCVLLTAVSWLTALTAAPLLPANVPVHYSSTGVPDAYASSNVAALYGLPLVTTALALAMVLLYLHPRYAALPGTLLLDLLPPRERAMVTAIVRANLVPAITLANLLLAYLHYSVVAVALGNRDRLDVAPLAAMVVLLLLTGTFYAVVSTRMVNAIVRRVRGK